jgi:hypothetical protein
MAVQCKSDSHSSTSAEVDLRIDNNGTWMDAFQFGRPGDQNWTLADQTFELDVQRNPYDELPLLSLTTANGRIIVDDEVQRVIHLNVPPDELQANLTPGFYVYDLVMVNAFEQRVPLMHGTLEVVQGVTYPP